MAAIRRRSSRAKIAAPVTLASPDDLNGTVDNTQLLDLSGAEGAVIYQLNNGTAGTLGVDVIEVSYDGGSTWQADPYLLAIAADPFTGTVNTALNAAGVEPAAGGAVFKTGPFHGPATIRCARGGAGAGGTAWATGAPGVYGVRIG